MATGRTCFHSQLPLAIREVFVYDYQETILVCSTTSGQNKVNLQCFEWDVSAKDWRVFPVTGFENTVVDTDAGTFISSARLPGNNSNSQPIIIHLYKKLDSKQKTIQAFNIHA